MTVDYRIINIGTTASNLLWGENHPVRTAHATTTLLIDSDRRILVDPSLPGQILQAKLFERTGKTLEWITDVFCTTLRPDFRRGLDALGHVPWWCGEIELQWYMEHLDEMGESAKRLESPDCENLRSEQEIIKKFRPAPEKFTNQIGLYPLPGATVGCCGLLLSLPTRTVVIAGPAAVTGEHVERGMVWKHSADKDQAGQSLQDILEIADIIVPAFDNIFFAPHRWM